MFSNNPENIYMVKFSNLTLNHSFHNKFSQKTFFCKLEPLCSDSMFVGPYSLCKSRFQKVRVPPIKTYSSSSRRNIFLLEGEDLLLLEEEDLLLLEEEDLLLPEEEH